MLDEIRSHTHHEIDDMDRILSHGDDWPSTPLPSEILMNIFDNISDRRTLKNIAQCSRRFNDAVRPRLYERIAVNCGSYGHEGGGISHPNRLRDLNLQLLRRQGFADCVRHVRLCGPTADDYAYQASLGSEPDDILKVAVDKYVRRPRNSSSKLTQTGTGWLTFDLDDRITCLVILFLLLPNVVSLHVQVPDETLLADNVLSLNVFAGLTQITLECMPHPTRMLPSTLMAPHFKDLVSLKALEKICLVRFGWLSGTHSMPPFRILKGLQSGATCLEFRKSSVNSEDMNHILSSFKSLQTFVYEQTYNSTLNRRHIRPFALLFALQTIHGKTLENVWLDYSDLHGLRQSLSQTSFSINSVFNLFANFTGLRRICLPMDYMCRCIPSPCTKVYETICSTFPQSIETIIFIKHLDLPNCKFYHIMEELSEVIRDARTERYPGLLPRLETIVVVASLDQFMQISPPAIERIESRDEIETIFATSDDRDKILLDRARNRKLREIESMMGVTNLGRPRWDAFRRHELGHGIRPYQVEPESSPHRGNWR